ncbi:hypothetical protein [Streptomyces sp. NPDC018059]|uniref:hypothetical protein n=1 Tax=Streptomyces sp. NPDC018059 TaxID=3365041 RepID=UPI0037AE6E11
MVKTRHHFYGEQQLLLAVVRTGTSGSTSDFFSHWQENPSRPTARDCHGRRRLTGASGQPLR